MNQQNYQSSIIANITAEEAFKNISHVSEWWTANFEGSSERLNDIFTVRFGETFAVFQVAEVIPGKRIVWLVTDCYLHWHNDKTEWNNTKIVWEIFSQNNSTKINFTHVGLIPEAECYNDCVKGWDHYITQSLFKLITENKGLPEKKKEIQTV
jgi:Activator of Hsp90 ATPase homolog 1-like protein